MKFEYKVLEWGNGKTLEKELNALGEAGWELTFVEGNKYIFKRPKK